MTPRVDIFGWKDSLPLFEIINEIEDVPYSRVPVYGESIDDVTGILYVREALETWVAGREGVTLGELAREHQTLFFTCHDRTLALFRELAPDIAAFRLSGGAFSEITKEKIT